MSYTVFAIVFSNW